MNRKLPFDFAVTGGSAGVLKKKRGKKIAKKKIAIYNSRFWVEYIVDTCLSAVIVSPE